MDDMTVEQWVEHRRAEFLAVSETGDVLTASCCGGPLDDSGLPTYDRAGRLLEGVIYWMANTKTGLKFGQSGNREAAKSAALRSIRAAS